MLPFVHNCRESGGECKFRGKKPQVHLIVAREWPNNDHQPYHPTSSPSSLILRNLDKSKDITRAAKRISKWRDHGTLESIDRQENFLNSRHFRMVKTVTLWPWWQSFNSFCFEILFFPLFPYFLLLVLPDLRWECSQTLECLCMS